MRSLPVLVLMWPQMEQSLPVSVLMWPQMEQSLPVSVLMWPQMVQSLPVFLPGMHPLRLFPAGRQSQRSYLQEKQCW
jgi:hypothetical protein